MVWDRIKMAGLGRGQVGNDHVENNQTGQTARNVGHHHGVGARVHFHAYTTEMIAEARLYGAQQLKPGDEQYVQLRLSEPALLLRSEERRVWGKEIIFREG